MPDGLQIAVVVLVALLVGALLPLVFSAFALVKQARRTLADLTRRTIAISERGEQVLSHVEKIAEGVEGELPTLRQTSQRIHELGTSIEQLTSTVHKIQAAGTILGPAIAAGLNAYRVVREAQEQTSSPAADSGPARNPTSQVHETPAGEEVLPDAVHRAIMAEIRAQEGSGASPGQEEGSKDA